MVFTYEKLNTNAEKLYIKIFKKIRVIGTLIIPPEREIKSFIKKETPRSPMTELRV